MFSLKTHDVYQEIQIHPTEDLYWRYQAVLLTREGVRKEYIEGLVQGTRMEAREAAINELQQYNDKYPPKEINKWL